MSTTAPDEDESSNVTIFDTSFSTEQVATVLYGAIVVLAYVYILWKAYQEMKAKAFAKHQQRQKWLLAQEEQKQKKRDRLRMTILGIPEGMEPDDEDDEKEKNIRAATFAEEREFSSKTPSPERDVQPPARHLARPTYSTSKCLQ